MIYTIKEDDGKVKIKNGIGGWTRPMLVGGKFFRSAADAGRAHDIEQTSRYYLGASNGWKVAGKEVAFATRDDVIRANKGAVAVDISHIEDEEEETIDYQFHGVVWPNGEVEVRGINIEFNMIRTSVEAIPEENSEVTLWLVS
jgi:hypothetical protein